ncbi:MAG: FAD-dependent oxidoreductase [Nocardiopsaceae bacterium]|nr:FAD-dependent oxidoreductase [Nocardiopsaceae bacterium]
MTAPRTEHRSGIVVVGTGGAGLCVALAAAEHGLHVDLIDKQDHIGGMLHIANGEFSGAGTRRQREHGIDDDPQRHFDDVWRLSHGKVDRELAWLTVRRQGEIVDWLDSLGFDFSPACPGLIHGHEVYSVPRTYWGRQNGLSVIRVLHERLRPLIADGRITLRLGTEATGLITERGQVTGVRVVPSATGETIELTAAAVVLATGGYDANRELRNRFLPEHLSSVLIGCLDHATGDGLVMAEDIGAAVSSDGVFLPIMGLIPDPSRPGHAVDYREAFIELAPAYRTPYEIWVNKRGERFVPEDTQSPEQRERELLRQPDATMHIIFDRAAAEAAPKPLINNPTSGWDQDRFLSACETSPWVTRAPDLETLADRLGIDADVLARTVGGYNDAVATGTDAAFGRSVLPSRLEQGPFYAITSVAASILSRDGLRVNTDLSVLDTAGNPIPGLHAVGEILGNNVFAGDNYVGGMSVTPAMTLGRLLGERLAETISDRSRS